MNPSARRGAAAVTALLLGAGLALAGPATAADDTAAPTLAGPVTFTPATVDITDHDAATSVRIPVADPGSGVASVQLELTGPGVPAATVDLQQASGTAASGVWTGTQTFSSRFDTAGTWTVAGLTATDRAGNSAQLDTGGAKVTVTRTADTAAPMLLGVTALTTAVDTTAGAASALVRVRAADDLSGVVAGTVRFTSPDGDIAEGTLTGVPVEGTATSGSWDVPVVFDARSAPGVWQLSGVEISDGQSNVATYDSSAPQLDPLRVAVSTAADGIAPVLTSLKVGPAKRSTAYGTSGWVYAQVGYTDDVSGVDSVTVTLKRPSGVPDDNDPQPVVVADADIRTGTAQAGTVTVPVFVDNLTAGSWKVAAVELVDVAGNVAGLTATTSGSGGALVAAAGFDVTTTAADTLAPTVGGYTFSPATVDTRGGSADGAVLVTATDPDTVPAGIVSGSIGLRSPSGNQTAVATFTGDDLAAGDPAAGTFRARFSLAAGAEDGAWTATSVTVVDGAGRRSTVSGNATTTLTVLGTGSDPATVPAAPTISRATVSGTAATVGWIVPDNGGAVLTDYRVSATTDGLAPRSITAPGTAAAATVPNLTRGRDWTFTVTARNAVGEGPASAPSAPVAVAAGVPDAPRIGTAAPAGDGTSAVVTWSAPLDDGGSALTGYRVVPLRDGVAQPAVELGPDATRATMTGLDRGRRYTFRVLATNAQGTGPASQPSGSVAVPATVPGAPVVTSTVAVGRTVTIRWSAPDDGGAPITAYRVTGSPAGACSSTTTSCVVIGLDEGTDYSFTVSATNRVGAGTNSPDSPTVTAQAPRPAALSASAPATIVRGAALTVAGRFVSAGRGVSGALVRAQYRLAGTATWVTAASARTAADGSVRVGGVRPARTAAVRLVSVSVGDYAPATSAARTVAVSRVVTLRTPRSVSKGRTLALTGTASPLHRGTLVLQRWTGRSWQRVSTRRVATSSYRFTVRPTTRGTIRYRVVAAADGWFAAAHSATRTVRVR